MLILDGVAFDEKSLNVVGDITSTGDITAGDDLGAGDDLILTGAGSQITVESNTQTSGNIASIICTPGSASTAQLLNLEAQGSNWASGSRVINIVADDVDTRAIVVNDGSSDTFALLQSGRIDMAGQLNLNNGGTISSTANGNITIAPNGTGITIIGDAGATAHSLDANDDLLVTGETELSGPSFVDDVMTFYASPRWRDSIDVALGNSADSRIDWSAAQTNHGVVWGLGDSSRYLIICEGADRETDFGVANQTNPTLILQSADATDVTQRRSLAHDQTNSIDTIGKGSHVTNHSAPVELADDASFTLPDASSGFGFFQAGDGEAYAWVSWTSAGAVTLVKNSANVAAADTDTNLCFIDGGTQVSVKNRLGAAKKIIFEYRYYTP